MPVDLRKFTQFYDHLFKIDFIGTLPGMRPRLSTEADVRAATARGRRSCRGFTTRISTSR
jgi:hypothetical protein